ncbi:tigger transposable element-derived protein 6 [Elysia marginata]|uniref:Tigger transposable element-derived protein 6 n=1 Tax=Elysia marginata TaxID=1093978 RepID=A0AAV4ISV5_9GAST|nr:tigger transposable element-derived protein 6 [Elysia marginata]
MDESGLFFKTSADKSFYIKGEKCGGGKKSKERITISLCANLLGEKEELVVIGKSARPRAFGSLNISDLPVTYKNSRKAWMTTEIFTHWLMGFNEKMKQQDRHVLLFLDNAPAYPTKQFSNVKLQFFPANTTSVLQPLDQGVIQAVKLRYREAQFRYMMTEMEADVSKTGSELMKQVHILNAIHWIAEAWKEVNPSTITKCFHKAGFSPSNDLTADEEIDIPEELNTLSLIIVGVNFAELPTIDADINICITEEVDWSKSATDLLINSSVKEDENSEEEDEAEREENCERITLQEAFSGFNKCRNFFQQRCNSAALQYTSAVEGELLKMRCQQQQKAIKDFFKKA